MLTLGVSAGRERVELLLAMGASRQEAAKGVLQRALSAVLTPALNQMSVLGLVYIPDFMSGQLLAGFAPLQAQSYIPFLPASKALNPQITQDETFGSTALGSKGKYSVIMILILQDFQQSNAVKTDLLQ